MYVCDNSPSQNLVASDNVCIPLSKFKACINKVKTATYNYALHHTQYVLASYCMHNCMLIM